MKIGLIDIDHSNFPNIALMKISAWHKKVGHQVEWYTPFEHYDIVYTLVNFDTTIDQDLERIYTLRKMGYWAYVMVYNKENADPIYKKIARWVNNRYIFAKCERFEDYWNNQNQNTNH